jgi:hypothetical protein
MEIEIGETETLKVMAGDQEIKIRNKKSQRSARMTTNSPNQIRIEIQE